MFGVIKSYLILSSGFKKSNTGDVPKKVRNSTPQLPPYFFIFPSPG